MKKLVVLTMVVALFIGIPFCVFAQEEPRDASKACKKFAADFPDCFATLFKNLGQCASYVQACLEPGNTPELYICRWVRAFDPQLYEETFKTKGLGPCIISFRDLY